MCGYVKSNTINIPQGSIYYRKNIIGASATLVCIHGTGSDSKIFLPMLAELKEDISVIALDLPAHGRSNFSGIPSLQNYLDAVIAVLDFEKISSFIPVGFSMGGALAFELYRRFKAQIPAMIFISSSATLPVSDIVFNLIKSDYASFCDFLVKFLYSKNANDALKSLSKEELASLNPTIIENDFRICSMIDYRSDLASIDTPTLIIANRKDKMLPLSLMEDLSQMIAKAKLVVFEEDGHMPHLENPKAAAEEIRRFLSTEIPLLIGKRD